MSSHHNQTREELSLEDCDALLNFPFHQYVPKVENAEDSWASSSFNNLFIEEGSFDESGDEGLTEPAQVENLYKLNKSYQEEVANTLFLVRRAIETNQNAQILSNEVIAQQRAQSMKSSARSCNAKPISLFAAPYFRDRRGRVPAANQDAKDKIKNCPVDAYLMAPKQWLAAESQKLKDGVADSVLTEALKPHKLRRDHLRNKLQNTSLPESEEPKIKQELENIELEIEKLQKLPLKNLYELAKGKIDWMTISATTLEGSRSPEQCECMWNNYLSDNINKNAFTPAEDKRLKQLAKQFKQKDWDKIAELLNTQRTAIQCFERYQVSLNEKFTRSYWTPEEDKHLEETVERLKVGDYIPWNDVCYYIEGRTRQQIINRYERSVSKEIVKAKWSTREDAMLLACYKLFGSKWNKMRNYLPHRSAYGIRERYCNALDPALKIGNWSLEEDKQLIRYIKEYGYGKWGRIAAHLPGRTDNMCLFRANRLMHHTKLKTLPELKNEDEDKTSVLVKKLKPFAPSKECVAQNMRLKRTRDMAFEMLLEVLQKIKPDAAFDSDVNWFDLSSFREPFLIQIQDELRKDMYNDDIAPSPEYKKRKIPSGVPKHKGRRLSAPCSFEDSEDTSSEDELELDDDSENFDENEQTSDDCNTDAPVKKKKYSEDDVILSKKVLEKRFTEAASIMPLHNTKGLYFCSMKTILESKLYLKHLQREFRVLAADVKDEDEDYTLNGKNLALGVSELTFCFINSCSPAGFQVLPPNVATLSAIEVMNESKTRIKQMADFVNHSQSYLNYLFDKETDPLCLKCTQQNNPDPNQATRCKPTKDSPYMETLEKPLKEKYFIPEERLVDALAIENSFSVDDPCVCEKLKESKAAVTLLRRRLLSIFLWPYLLSNTYFTDDHYALLEETEFPELIHTSTRVRVKRKYKRNRRGVKKGDKRPAAVNKSYGIKVPSADVIRKTKNIETPVSEFRSIQKRRKLEQNSSEVMQNDASPSESSAHSSSSPKENDEQNASTPTKNIGSKVNLNLSLVPTRRSKRLRVSVNARKCMSDFKT